MVKVWMWMCVGGGGGGRVSGNVCRCNSGDVYTGSALPRSEYKNAAL